MDHVEAVLTVGPSMLCSVFRSRSVGAPKCDLPVELKVVNLKLAVGGDPAGLYRTQICANDLGSGIQVGHIYGPDACPGAKVQDLFRVFNRTQVQGAAHLQPLIVVLDVHAVQLLLVIWEVIFASLVGMIPAAVLELVVGDSRFERGA